MDYYLIALIMFAGASLQGITGFGSGLVAVPLLSLLIPLPQLTPLLSIINVVMALYLCWLLRHYLAPRKWLALLIFGVVGTLLGNWALAQLPLTWLQLGLAIFVISVGALFWFGLQIRAGAGKRQQSLIGLASGFANGALTLGGPPVVLFLTANRLERTSFRATLTLFFLVLGLTNVTSFSLQGAYTAANWGYLMVLLMGAIAGTYLGHRLSPLLPESLFRRLTLLLVISAGVVVLLTR